MPRRARRPVFVDADVFLSFLRRDDEDLYMKALGLFELAEEGTLRLETTVGVLAEVVSALEGRFGLGREEIREIAEAICSTRNLKVADVSLIRDALRIYSAGTPYFSDALKLAHARARGIALYATFDAARLGDAAGLKLTWKEEGP